MKNNNTKIIYGDFQTPLELSNLIINLILDKKINVDSILEPTCGMGNILLNAHIMFKPKYSIGIEINNDYCSYIENKNINNLRIIRDNIFEYFNNNDITNFFNINDNLLLIGNTPWVTNSYLSLCEIKNIPNKNNKISKLNGIDAIMGKSNFDISEFIFRILIEKFYKYNFYFAFLCKTSVARKILKYLWDNNLGYKIAEIYNINSKQYFNVDVNACLFFIDFSQKKTNNTCYVYNELNNNKISMIYGYNNNNIINNIEVYNQYNFYGTSYYKWRSGIKHDCKKVMEFDIVENENINGFNQIVNLESDILYPLIKSSDLSKESIKINKNILITQKYIGEDTEYIKYKYPKTWNYLKKYEDNFNNRKSIIYKNKPKYSIFSIGDYSFKPFKIAISGLYKKISFKLIKPFQNKSVMFDDTCYFISFDDENECNFIYYLLNNDMAMKYLNSIIFWDSKRPIKTEILNNIDILKIAKNLNLEKKYIYFISKK